MVYKDINLLPYEIILERERREKRLKYTIIISFFLIIAIYFMTIPRFNYEILKNEEKTLQNQLAQEEQLDTIEKEIQTLKSELDVRYGVLNYINQDRIDLLDVFVNLEEKLPSDVFLTNFNVNGKEVSMSVVARNVQAVSDFIYILKQEQKYDQITTYEISKQTDSEGEVALVQFDINLILVNEKEEGN